MRSKIDIVLLTTETSLGSEVETALNTSNNGFAQPTVYSDLLSLSSQLEAGNVSVVLIDIDSYTDALLDDIESMVNSHIQARFVILTSELRSALVLKAMQAGVRHVQLKETLSSELADVLHRIAPKTSAQNKKTGSVITVLSAGGGCGATTLVVNLANELQLTTSNPVLIVDLDYTYGAVGTYLELHGSYGIADVLSRKEEIDAELIDSTAVEHSEKLHALISPATVNYAHDRVLETAGLDTVLGACKEGHAFTLIDAPRVSLEVAVTLANESEMTLVVLQPMIKDIRIAKAIMTALIDRGVPPTLIKPIINRYQKRHQMITIDEAQEVLGDTEIRRLSNDYTSAVRGINFGEPLARSAPRSALRKELAEFASQISKLKVGDNGRLHTIE